MQNDLLAQAILSLLLLGVGSYYGWHPGPKTIAGLGRLSCQLLKDHVNSFVVDLLSLNSGC